MNTQSYATLTIGGVSGPFCVTTGLLTLQQLLRILPMMLDD